LSPRIEQAFAARPLRWPLGPPKILLATFAASVGLWLAAARIPIAGCRSQAVIDSVYHYPFAVIGSIWILAIAAAGLALALRDRHWGVGSIATICALCSLWFFVDHVEGGVADCGSLKPFARQVATGAPADVRLFFFRDPLPAVALYAERRIPTLRDPIKAPPQGSFLLILPESLRGDVPPDWLAASRVVASGRGRVFTRKPMGIELLAISSGAPP